MQVEVDEICIHSKFRVTAPLVLKILLLFVLIQTFFWTIIIVHGGQKNRISSKSSCKQRLICKPILVGMASLVLEILLFFKNSQVFPLDHGLQSMGVKKQNRLKKFMQVDTHAHQVWWDGISGFQDYTPFHLPSSLIKIPFQTINCSLWGSKNRIKQNWLKKFMQVQVDEICICTKFGGHGLFGFKNFTLFSFPSNLPFRAWITQLVGVKKWNRLLKLTQIEFDEVHICTKFGG